MTDVAYNSPQYGYGTGVPPQPVPPQPMPLPSEQPDQPVASYDVDPSPGHAPPAVVQAVSFDKPESTGEPVAPAPPPVAPVFEERSEEHTSELQSRRDLVCRLLLEKKK